MKQFDKVDDEARWKDALARSQDILKALANEALSEYRAGQTKILEPDALGRTNRP